MDPSSGSPRSARQPPISEEAPITVTESNNDAAENIESDAGEVVDAQHLARFEFSQHGTKILMVEWYPGAVPPTPGSRSEPAPDPADGAGLGSGHSEPKDTGIAPPSAPSSVPAPNGSQDKAEVPAALSWEVSWTGKSTVLPVNDSTDHGSRRRLYFLLPPAAPVPATITVSASGRSPLTLKPLPAIFPEGFSPEAGTQGVLHTIWAKKRVSELEREIEAELRTNPESVGLEMALSEKQWIMDNFINPPPPPPPPQPSNSTTTRAPVTGRLCDKLKGLKLATSPADLAPSSRANTFTKAGSQSRSFSPQSADVAIPSLSAVARGNLAAAPMSLDAAVRGDPLAASAPVRVGSGDGEDDLFALPMSPRSPDMVRSPFSAL